MLKILTTKEAKTLSPTILYKDTVVTAGRMTYIVRGILICMSCLLCVLCFFASLFPPSYSLEIDTDLNKPVLN